MFRCCHEHSEDLVAAERRLLRGSNYRWICHELENENCAWKVLLLVYLQSRHSPIGRANSLSLLFTALHWILNNIFFWAVIFFWTVAARWDKWQVFAFQAVQNTSVWDPEAAEVALPRRLSSHPDEVLTGRTRLLIHHSLKTQYFHRFPVSE